MQQSAVIKCYFKLGKTATEVYQDLKNMYSDDSVMHVFQSMDIFQTSVRAHAPCQKSAVPKQQLAAVTRQSAHSLHVECEAVSCF